MTYWHYPTRLRWCLATGFEHGDRVHEGRGPRLDRDRDCRLHIRQQWQQPLHDLQRVLSLPLGLAAIPPSAVTRLNVYPEVSSTYSSQLCLAYWITNWYRTYSSLWCRNNITIDAFSCSSSCLSLKFQKTYAKWQMFNLWIRLMVLRKTSTPIVITCTCICILINFL